MSSEISEFGYGLNLIANTGAQASVRNSDSWPGRGSSSASLCGLRRVMITVRIALMVMTATVMYPVPGSVSRLGPQLPPQPEHEREPRHAGERCGGDAQLGRPRRQLGNIPVHPPKTRVHTRLDGGIKFFVLLVAAPVTDTWLDDGALQHGSATW
jgi:hypothetical protein